MPWRGVSSREGAWGLLPTSRGGHVLWLRGFDGEAVGDFGGCWRWKWKSMCDLLGCAQSVLR